MSNPGISNKLPFLKRAPPSPPLFRTFQSLFRLNAPPPSLTKLPVHTPLSSDFPVVPLCEARNVGRFTLLFILETLPLRLFLSARFPLPAGSCPFAGQRTPPHRRSFFRLFLGRTVSHSFTIRHPLALEETSPQVAFGRVFRKRSLLNSPL